MRLTIILACGGLAACTTGDVTVPADPILYQVPAARAPSSSGGGDFTGTIENALGGPTAVRRPRAAADERGGHAAQRRHAEPDALHASSSRRSTPRIAERAAGRGAGAAGDRAADVGAARATRASTSRSTPSRRATRWASGSIARNRGLGGGGGLRAVSRRPTRRSGRSSRRAGRARTRATSIPTATASPAAGIRRRIGSCAARRGVRPIEAPSPNFGPRRGGVRPDLVVLHYTAMATRRGGAGAAARSGGGGLGALADRRGRARLAAGRRGDAGVARRRRGLGRGGRRQLALDRDRTRQRRADWTAFRRFPSRRWRRWRGCSTGSRRAGRSRPSG